jgi:hypothetical protein
MTKLILVIVIVLVLIREIWGAWKALPGWFKRNLRFFRRDEEESRSPDPHDVTSIFNIASKLQALFTKTSEKLESSLSDEESRAALLVMIQFMSQLKKHEADERDERYARAGEQQDPAEALEGLDEAFELAFWAYDEFPADECLKDTLESKGFALIRHDKDVLPGCVAHYIALSRERKVAVVGVKGTSSVEDMITDCVGGIVTHELEDPIVQGGKTSIRCHEGVIIAARRLARDLEVVVEELLLPVDYKLLITGHSLGGGVAALVGVILRSRLPQLSNDEGGVMKVLAFGSPPVLDHDSALACRSFVSSIVNNSDVIPRSSLSNLVVMSRFLQSVHEKMVEKGVSPRDLKSAAALMQLLTKGSDGEMIMTTDEAWEGLGRAFADVELDDPDHLYVPGRVIHMYDLWGKKEYGRVEEKNETPGTGDVRVEGAPDEIRTAERLYVGDGTSEELRHIEMDSRLLSDHLPTMYRSSIKALLSSAGTD